MSLIRVWAALLLAYAQGTQCDVGARINDWEHYWNAHPPVMAWSIEFDDGSTRRQIHLFVDAGNEQTAFFYDPYRYPHGTCAVILPGELKVAP